MDIIFNIEDIAVKTIDSVDDVVVEVYFKITGIGELGSAITINKTLLFNSIDAKNFTSFEELSKEQVINWLFNDSYSEDMLRAELQEAFNENKKIFKTPSSWD